MVWTQILTWLLIIAGWVIVNHQNNIREKRKEIRVTLDKIQIFLDEIENQAIQYHTVEASNDLSFQLKRNLNQKLRDKLKILKTRNLDVKTCNSHLTKFRQAVTLDNFDTSNYKTQTLNDDLIKNILLTKDRLSQEFEQSFAKRYP